MSSHKNTDAHGSAPLWALTAVKKAPTAANMGAAGSGKLFNNATEDNLITDVTIGLFNFKDTETQSGKVAHAGWNMKVTGTGGRASRVQYETLVALTNSADA
tara:strand:- start:148 stop:453 length:306 start_codon:yes stop_codon:yes gene_type:complete